MSARVLLVLLALAAIAGSPWIAYGVGLANVDGRPSPPLLQKLSNEQMETLHVVMRKAGVLDVHPLSPWQYALDSLQRREAVRTGGIEAARIVAHDHTANRLKVRGARLRELSDFALMIWLTRNWKSDEILARAYEIKSR